MSDSDIFQRSTFQIDRKCGRCDGSGEGRASKKCPNCDGLGSKRFTLYASDLTNDEIDSLDYMDRLAVESDLQDLALRNYKASKAAENYRWEDERKTIRAFTSKGEVEIPIQDLRKTEKEVRLPLGSTDPKAWKKALEALDRREKESGESRVLGGRSYGVKGQRLLA